jgi:Ca2+-binding EF-hand superfamily protein
MNKLLIAPISLLAGLATVALQPAAAATATDVVTKYDKDSDKTLDLNEVKSAAAAHFDRLDKDSDQTLDGKELTGVVGPKTLAAADADHDGTLSKDEYMTLVEKAFKRADVDHDGTLDAAELDSSAGKALRRLID